jgi:peptide/nickel transport system substrate-binding protein
MGGNMVAWIELHSNGLVTSDAGGRPVPLLAADRPSLERGTIVVSDDGRMSTRWSLRPDASWHDGVPLTARDILFGVQVQSDPEIPFSDRGAMALIEAIELLDDHNVVISWKRTYYLADALGAAALWPLPAHVLQSAYAAGEKEQFRNLPYWTTEYVHAGPFRLARYEQGREAAFEAYDRYFLGRPKVDRVVIREILDRNASYAAVLAGAIDLSVELFDAEKAASLEEQWSGSGGGKVLSHFGATFFIAFQFGPDLVRSRELLDPRVRRALYLALDRTGLTELAYGGRPAPEGEGTSILPPTDPLYPYVKDVYTDSANAPQRAAQVFGQAGWQRGPDGLLASAEGRPLPVEIRSSRENVAAAAASMWRQVGVDTSIVVPPPALASNREYAQAFPGVELTGAGDGDRILNRIYGPNSATAVNAYSGSNRGHYEDPRLDDLISRYRSGLRESERGGTMRQIADVVGADLPLLVAYYNPIFATVGARVRAFDDLRGGHTGAPPFGPLVRNAHQWETGTTRGLGS